MKPLKDSQFNEIKFHLSEREHHYGKNVHLLSDPFLHSHLARLCDESTYQPVINELMTTLYSSLLKYVVNNEFPQKQVITHSRMSAFHPEGIFESSILDADIPVVSVNLARAGTLPSHVCYHHLNYFMNPKTVRQDHVGIARKTNDSEQVTGSAVSGHKIGGAIDDAIVLFPDPMGATGGTLIESVDLYQKFGKARKFIAIHCIVTPEYLKAVHAKHPELIVYAIRLDRGLSNDKVLASIPGTYWNEEKGLNDKHYIVPGGGGFGEILNNAYV
jgi:uracil phosphoribosyltransferase